MRLLLSRSRASGRDQRPDAFRTDVLNIVEIDTEEKIAAFITFDSDDFEAAFAELDARYLAGEAAAHAHTWSVIAGSYASISRDELPQTTPDCMSVDHRRVAAFEPGDLTAYVRAGLDLNQHISTYIETVHRLNDLGAVVTHVAHGASREGFEADWRAVDISTVDGDTINRCRAFRGGRSRRCAREVRRAQPPGTDTDKHGKPSGGAVSGALCGGRLGRHGGHDRRRLLR